MDSAENRPLSVSLVGYAFAIFGALSVWEMLYMAVVGDFSINLAVFWLPVGIGLLRGKRSSWKWAKRWITLLGLIFVGLLLITLLGNQSFNMTWLGNPLRGAEKYVKPIGLILPFIVILYFAYRGLISDPAREFFR